MEVPRFESHEEDIYEPVLELGDYLNELQAAGMVIDGELIRVGNKMKTVEERYKLLKGRTGGPSDEEIQKLISAHPKKVELINYLAHLINEHGDDTILFMQASNKLHQLVKGKDTPLFYTEPEANPDNLAL